MPLPRGVTGFCIDTAPALSFDGLRAFRRRCYEAALEVSGAVVGDIDPYRPCNSFAATTIKTAGGAVAVLLNAHHPIIGFANPPRSGTMVQTYVDAPALAEAFRRFGEYDVWDLAALTRPLSLGDVADLTEGERRQIKYWEPQCVGDVIFNHWD